MSRRILEYGKKKPHHPPGKISSPRPSSGEITSNGAGQGPRHKCDLSYDLILQLSESLIPFGKDGFLGNTRAGGPGMVSDMKGKGWKNKIVSPQSGSAYLGFLASESIGDS